MMEKKLDAKEARVQIWEELLRTESGPATAPRRC